MGIVWRIIRIGFPALVSGIQRTLNMFFIQVSWRHSARPY
jgi:hypothetical protein